MSGLSTQAGFFSAAGGGSPVASSIVSLWDFESGARTDDSAGTNDLTENGTVTYSTGKVGDAAGVSFGNSFSRTGHIGSSGTDAKTYFGWLKSSDTSNTPNYFLGLGKKIGSPGQSVLLSLESGVMWLRTRTYVANYGSDIADGDWHSFAIAFPDTPNLSDVNVFIDGVLATATVVTNGPLNLDTENTYVGASAFSTAVNQFVGDIDQIGIADTEWSLSDHQYVYNGGTGRPTNDILTP